MIKSMLILTDFSEAAFRAAEYGCELAGYLGVKRIVLYHAYQPAMAFAGTPEAAGITIDPRQIYLDSMKSLGMLQDRLKPMTGNTITLDLLANDTGPAGLSELISEQGLKEGLDIIVMGVSGKSGLEKFILGSTTTRVLKESEWPVLIVPEDTRLGKGIKTIVLASDLKEVDTLPVKQLNEFLDCLPGKLELVNVEPEKEEYSVETRKTISSLHTLLEKYDPSFNYITGKDIVEEILRFATEKDASLIIAIHQQQGFLSNLFHKSTTKKLAYRSAVPLLSLPALK